MIGSQSASNVKNIVPRPNGRRPLLLFLSILTISSSADAGDVVIMTEGRLSGGFDIGVATSGVTTDWISRDETSLRIRYPGGDPSAWGAVFIRPIGTSQSRPTRDMSTFPVLVIEMSGDQGTAVSVGVKDAKQPDDGSEAKIAVGLSPGLRTSAFPLGLFAGANLRNLYVLMELVFTGSRPINVRLRNVKFTSPLPDGSTGMTASYSAPNTCAPILKWWARDRFRFF